jgi:hypothetical protein
MAVAIETRLPLARATEVGEWVVSLAHESLAKRAADVTSVESASEVEMVPAEGKPVGSSQVSGPAYSLVSGSGPAVVKRADPDPRATVPDVPPAGMAESTESRIAAVSSPILAPPRASRQSRTVIAVAAIAASAAIVVAWIIVTARSAPQARDAPAAAAVEGTPVPVSVPAPSTEPSPAPPPSYPSASSPSAAAATSVSAAVAVTAAPGGATAPAHAPKLPRGRTDPVPAPTKAPTLGGVLDSRH